MNNDRERGDKLSQGGEGREEGNGGRGDEEVVERLTWMASNELCTGQEQRPRNLLELIK